MTDGFIQAIVMTHDVMSQKIAVRACQSPTIGKLKPTNILDMDVKHSKGQFLTQEETEANYIRLLNEAFNSANEKPERVAHRAKAVKLIILESNYGFKGNSLAVTALFIHVFNKFPNANIIAFSQTEESLRAVLDLKLGDRVSVAWRSCKTREEAREKFGEREEPYRIYSESYLIEHFKEQKEKLMQMFEQQAKENALRNAHKQVRKTVSFQPTPPRPASPSLQPREQELRKSCSLENHNDNSFRPVLNAFDTFKQRQEPLKHMQEIVAQLSSNFTLLKV